MDFLSNKSGISNEITVLFVEDNEVIQNFYNLFLKEFDLVNCFFASTIEKALCLIQDNRFSIIFTDINLSDGDGFTLCDKIHTNTNCRDIPVVVVTSAKIPEEKKKVFDDFIEKPLTKGKFIQVLEKHLTKNSKIGERRQGQ